MAQKKKHVASTGPEDNLQFRLSQLDGLCLDNRAGREVQPGDVFSLKKTATAKWLLFLKTNRVYGEKKNKNLSKKSGKKTSPKGKKNFTSKSTPIGFIPFFIIQDKMEQKPTDECFRK